MRYLGSALAALWAAAGALLAAAAACGAAAWQWALRQMPQRRPPTRRLILRELALAEGGRARVEEEEADVVGKDAMASTISIRATRAPRTVDGARRALTMIREFVEANPGILRSSRGQPTHTTYDVVIEAFVYAEEAGVAGEPCPWHRARRPQDASAARNAGAARAALERLGWSRGGTWSRSKLMAKAWGVGDPEDVQHHAPIFVWELVEGIRLAGRPTTPWAMCGVAMAALSVLGARRGGGAATIKVGEISASAADAVEVAPRTRPKEHRARATQRPRKQSRPIVLQHWLVREFVSTWLQWHRRRKSPPSALLFPCIYTAKPRVASALGYWADGQWVEPLREWTPRQRALLLQQYIPSLGDRSFHGFRSGNQCELRRWKEVSAVTRRALHGRSLKHLIGSEAAYDEVFAEDYSSAVQRLGQLRITRTRTGLLSVVATSPSAGENPADWVPVTGAPITFTHVPNAAAAGSSDEESSDSEGEQVVGDGGRDTRVIKCGRCRQRLGARDYGYLCDIHGCTWGVCTACHPGGAKAELRCPDHRAHGIDGKGGK